MKNWSAIAAAAGLDLPAAELERITRPLDGLETAFRPLAESLGFDDESAIVFDAAEDAK
jgi:hypothetical protein